MPELHVTMRNGEQADLNVRPGLTIMEAIRDTGAEDVFATCGGGCSCATCHVFVDSEWLERTGELGPFEDDLLESAPDRAENSRLSCQIIMTEELDGISVTVAPIDD